MFSANATAPRRSTEAMRQERFLHLGIPGFDTADIT